MIESERVGVTAGIEADRLVVEGQRSVLVWQCVDCGYQEECELRDDS